MTTKQDAIPVGWARVSLGEVAHLALGKMLDKANRTSGKPMPYLRNSNVRWHDFHLTDVYEMPFEPREIERYSAREGDVMVCEGGEPGRAAVWQGPPIMFQKAIHRLRPRESAFDPRWLVWHLRYDALTGRLSDSFTGTTIKHLTGSALAKYQVVLPPLSEQRRIIAKLDALQAASRAARAALDAVPALLERYSQGVLAAAFRGELRASPLDAVPVAAQGSSKGVLPQLPSSWCWKSAADVVEPGAEIVYGIVQPGPHVPDGIPYIRGKDIQDGIILSRQLLRTSPAIAERYRRAALQHGDVLLGIIRATKVAVVPAELTGANITQGTARFRPSGGIRTDFLAGWLASPYAQAWLHAKYRGIDMPGLNLRDVRQLPVPVAPLAEQDAVAALINEAGSRIQSTRHAIAQSTDRLDALELSALSKAFRGELEPQDPHDESAAALVQRLSSARSTEPSSRARRPVRKEARRA